MFPAFGAFSRLRRDVLVDGSPYVDVSFGSLSRHRRRRREKAPKYGTVSNAQKRRALRRDAFEHLLGVSRA